MNLDTHTDRWELWGFTHPQSKAYPRRRLASCTSLETMKRHILEWQQVHTMTLELIIVFVVCIIILLSVWHAGYNVKKQLPKEAINVEATP